MTDFALRSRPGNNAALSGRGFSFVEVLVAITILIMSVGFIVTTFGSRGNEAQKASNHYIAMFIATKILEDIDNGVRENPFHLAELKKFDRYYKLFEKDSPFFSSLEDFNRDGKLNELFSSHKEGFDLKKLDEFEYKLELSPVKNYESLTESVADAKVSVKWNDSGVARDYSIGCSFSGYPLPYDPNDASFDATVTPGMIDDMRSALACGSTEPRAYAGTLGDDPDSIYYLAMTAALVNGLKKLDHEIDVEIQTLRNSPAGDLYSKIALAKLYEKRSVTLMDGLSYIKVPASRMLKLLKSNSFKIDGFLAANPGAAGRIRDAIGLLRRVDAATGAAAPNSLVNRFSESIGLSLTTYIDMLREPSVSSKLSLRERQSIFSKLIDIGNAVILNRNENMIITIDQTPISVKQLVKNCIRNLQMYYEMRNINRSKYLAQILEKFNDPTAKSVAEKALEKNFDDISSMAKFAEILYKSM